MSKIALISDLHLGVKKSDKTFLDNQMNFLYNEFVPYLKNNNINMIAILGDLFDTRNTLNIFMVSKTFRFFEYLKEQNIFVYIFQGNHDTYFKTTNEVHSLNFLKKFDNVCLIEDIELKEIEKRKLLFVPWVVNNEDFKKRVANKNLHCDVCFGHFDIVGFPLNNTTICQEGLETSLFLNNYTLTFSGHFHKRSTYKIKDREIIMIGSPYQITRNDKGDERGFCILDLETLTYEFVNSNRTIKFIDLKYPEKFTSEQILGNVIDVYVNYNGNDLIDKELQKYVQGIEEYNPAYPPNIFMNNTLFDGVENDIKIKSLSEMIDDFIDNLQIDNKNEIKDIINELYSKSKSSE